MQQSETWRLPNGTGRGAEESYKRAVALNQNDATAHLYYSGYLCYMRRFDEALSEGKKALAVDPLSFLTRFMLAFSYFFKHEDDSAMTQINETLSIDSNFVGAYRALGSFSLGKAMLKTLSRSIIRPLRLVITPRSRSSPRLMRAQGM